MLTIASSSIVLAVLDNPVVLDLLITAIGFVIGWAGTKVLSLIDSKWANEHLSGVGRHINAAAEAGAREYVRRIDLADDDGVVTADERAVARKAAIDTALDEIGLGRLKSALSKSLGKSVSDDGAREFIANGVDTALARLLPGFAPRTADGTGSSSNVDNDKDADKDVTDPLDETERMSK